MSEESKLREELKAQAAEAIDALSLEELKTVSGGVNDSKTQFKKNASGMICICVGSSTEQSDVQSRNI